MEKKFKINDVVDSVLSCVGEEDVSINRYRNLKSFIKDKIGHVSTIYSSDDLKRAVFESFSQNAVNDDVKRILFEEDKRAFEDLKNELMNEVEDFEVFAFPSESSYEKIKPFESDFENLYKKIKNVDYAFKEIEDIEYFMLRLRLHILSSREYITADSFNKTSPFCRNKEFGDTLRNSFSIFCENKTNANPSLIKSIKKKLEKIKNQGSWDFS